MNNKTEQLEQIGQQIEKITGHIFDAVIELQRKDQIDRFDILIGMANALDHMLDQIGNDLLRKQISEGLMVGKNE